MATASDNSVIWLAAGIACVVVLVGVFLFNNWLQYVIEDDRKEEPVGSKWVKNADAMAEEDEPGDKKAD
eukprot:CAMPEP_0181506930 /NCGR_PEP_ID=MMETSP1110-20121109/58867_1 /TAXON_ID=174948 /ORGANISM="Symbiodinium sp., Strain CCMP421" /LENGTH=68 /DNA_ID=CAMNT_0023636041 /DNA_START=48 /DNA_END=254 /DNA_ORIENTATION=+